MEKRMKMGLGWPPVHSPHSPHYVLLAHSYIGIEIRGTTLCGLCGLYGRG
jgi:hypothetical protein